MSTTARDAPKRLSLVEEFTAELNRVIPVMTRVARRFAPFGDAEDFTQEACLAAWRYRYRFDPEKGSFQTWILKILFHESRKAVAHGRRTGLLLGRLADRSHLSTEALPGGGDRQLESAIARLPRRQRAVIGLYYFVDLSVQEVAALLGVAGICGSDSGAVAPVVANPDTPDPRCLIVTANQRLRVVNGSNNFGQPGKPITVTFAGFAPRIVPIGKATLFDRPLGEYIAPGNHFLHISLYPGSGANVWLKP